MIDTDDPAIILFSTGFNHKYTHVMSFVKCRLPGIVSDSLKLLNSFNHWKSQCPFKKPIPGAFSSSCSDVPQESCWPLASRCTLPTSVSHRTCNSLQPWVSGQKTSPCARTRWQCVLKTCFFAISEPLYVGMFWSLIRGFWCCLMSATLLVTLRLTALVTKTVWAAFKIRATLTWY